MHDEGQGDTGKTGDELNGQQGGTQDEAGSKTQAHGDRISEEVEKTKKLAEIAGGGSNKGSWSGSNEDLDQADRRNTSTDD